MLILPRQIHDLVDLGFRDLVGENPTNSDPLSVDLKHDRGRLLPALFKEPF